MFKASLSRPALATVAAGITLASTMALAGTAGAATRPAVAPRPASTEFSDWPMFGGNATHTGVSSETAISTVTATTLTAGPTVTLGATSYTSPAVATSTTLGKALVYAAAGGALSAHPTTGGAAVWTYRVGTGNGTIETSPDVFNGVVYFATTKGTIDAVNSSTGALVCSYKTGQEIEASPVVVNAPDGSGPVVYDGTDPTGKPGAEWALYGAGNTHGACAKDWEFTAFTVSPGGSWSSPAYSTDSAGTPLLVFGSRDDDDSVYALNATTGALAWRYNTSSQANFDVGASPTISAPGVNGFAGGVVYVTGKDKSVYAINLTTGSLIWSTPLTKATNGDLSSSALTGDTLFLGSDAGVYALNATTGAVVWNVQTAYTFYSSPVVTGPAGQQVVVIGNNEGRLYALKAANGATEWTARPTTKGFWASPAVSQGAIFTVGLDGVLRTYTPGA